MRLTQTRDLLLQSRHDYFFPLLSSFAAFNANVLKFFSFSYCSLVALKALFANFAILSVGFGPAATPFAASAVDCMNAGGIRNVLFLAAPAPIHSPAGSPQWSCP